jgi:class 3 adenylate cyclase/tetratricopeptide (TPR) repeat protein
MEASPATQIPGDRQLRLLAVPTCPNCGEDNPERARFCMGCTAPLVAVAVRGKRRTVTIVFSDLVGSTALGERLDAETLREVLDRYFEEMRACLERHGGAVEKYIGDAVMAVFGLPRAHEDDALRAVRAASDMKEELEELNGELEARWGVRLSNRTGVHTGEVVTGDPTAGQRLVTGDAVNTAARLEQAASAGDVLIGKPTYELTLNAVEVKPVEPVVAKGKAAPVPAYQLLAIRRGDTPTAQLDAPMVGRHNELQELLGAFEDARDGRRCVLATIIGDAGVGKTRLVAELLSRIGARALIAQGRCLPYGEGITYWAFSEAIRHVAGVAEGEPREVALRKLAALCENAKESDLIAERVATAMGLGTTPFPEEDLAWGFRKLIEHLSAEQPLVLVVDDVQWADPTLLETITSIARLAKDASALLLCIARPELEETHDKWAETVEGRVTVRLEPLSKADSEILVAELLGGVDIPGDSRERITHAAGGNPLFIEQMLSMWLDQGLLVLGPEGLTLTSTGEGLPIPPSIQALLAARLDGLIEHERATLERGAVVGQTFYRGAVEALSPGPLRPSVAAGLWSLQQRRLIRAEESPFVGDEAFAFVHLLVRDAAYDAMLKRTRAELHEAFADWLSEKAGDRLPEYEEIVGYHLEQAYRHHLELGILDDHAILLRGRAAEHLSAAASRAFATNNMRASAALFDRALSLIPEDDTSMVAVLPDLGSALLQIGELDRARTVLERAEDQARSSGDLGSATLARIVQIQLSIKLDIEESVEAISLETKRAIELCLELGEDRGAATGFHVMGEIYWWQCRFAAAEEAFRSSVESAERVGDRRQASDSLAWLAVAAHHGPTSVGDGIERCLEISERAPNDRLVQLATSNARAGLLAMRGEFDEARKLVRLNRGVWQDLGWLVEEGADSQLRAEIELLAGDLEAAERELRWGCDVLDRLGEKGYLSTTVGMLARVLASQTRLDEAERFIQLSAETGASDDIRTQVEWRMAKAEVLVRRGDTIRADDLATQGVEFADRSDELNLRGDARMVLARVLLAAGLLDWANRVASEAVELYERKGNIVSAERARNLLRHMEGGSES